MSDSDIGKKSMLSFYLEIQFIWFSYNYYFIFEYKFKNVFIYELKLNHFTFSLASWILWKDLILLNTF